MKHLLSSIESRALDLSHADIDITQLLTNVRDTRDLKSVEGLTDAMEKVLQELRSTEHAAPFLKPVKRSEAPNYDLFITEPMDLSTMARKVRQHSYKTKRDFIYDLNLIWTNCLKYNSEPTHPLRRSTAFMQKKTDQAVEKYLGGVGSVDSRSTPIPQLNVNGLDHNHHAGPHVNGRDTSVVNDGNTKIRIKLQTPKAPASRGKADGHSLATDGDRHGSSPNKNGAFKEATSAAAQRMKNHHQHSGATRVAQSSFADSPAIIRTPQTMRQYYDLDYAMQPHLDSKGAGPSKPSGFHLSLQHAQTRLMSNNSLGSSGSGYLSMSVNGGTGTLAELQSQLESAVQRNEINDASLSRSYRDFLTAGIAHGSKRSTQSEAETVSNHPRKRPKTSPTPEQALIQKTVIQEGQLLGAWWGAMASGDLIGNGAPLLPSEPSQSPNQWQHLGNSHASRSKAKGKLKSSHPKEIPGLKGTIYKNIDSLRRIRRTHTALLSTVATGSQANDEDMPKRNLQAVRRPDPPPLSQFPPSIGNMNGRIRGRVPAPIPIEGGSKLANMVLRSNCAQLLEHSGFEGSSFRALDMIANVAGEFLMNMGRTLRFLSDQRPLSMNPEEIVLHTLLESGVPEVRRLDAYIRDDVERYGSRLTDLERKLHNAWEDELDANAEANEFNDDLVDDDDALIAGDFLFAADRDEDFFGLRALGLEKELGLASLTVPSRLFHGRAKKGVNGDGSGPGGSKEPTLPFPPPRPFILLNSHKIDSQIGLLRGYYRGKFDKHRESTGPPPLPPPAPTVPVLSADGSAPQPPTAPSVPPAPPPPFDYSANPPLMIPDDQPSAPHMKMGPIGQITVPTSSSVASASRKKKSAAAAGTGDGGAGGPSNSAPKAKSGGATGAKAPAKKKNPKTSPKKPATTTNVNGNTLPPQPQPPTVLAS